MRGPLPCGNGAQMSSEFVAYAENIPGLIDAACGSHSAVASELKQSFGAALSASGQRSRSVWEADVVIDEGAGTGTISLRLRAPDEPAFYARIYLDQLNRPAFGGREPARRYAVNSRDYA